jgi:hypothetical protein
MMQGVPIAIDAFSIATSVGFAVIGYLIMREFFTKAKVDSPPWSVVLFGAFAQWLF